MKVVVGIHGAVEPLSETYFAALDESLVWTCPQEGIRQVLQAYMPDTDALKSPSKPSIVMECVEYVKEQLPIVIHHVVPEPTPYVDGTVY